jgi:hypothetical protein
MATLVLSTVGQALGGPIGGAIGALIGQSIDQHLLGGSSRGPRLGELKVQTSSYGTQIPRVYGSMRIAGTVVWATDLVESEETAGAKGQPDTVFSYSVSLAVALSSRAVERIGRIWADGKLLRGEDGQFKVSTKFRFYPGTEDQEADSFIASNEGAQNTPAYRGMALAMFENLELAEFGNRIPFFTFEIVGDEGPVGSAEVLHDASGGVVNSNAAGELIGYAAYGRSMKAAIQPLIDCYAVDLFDNGFALVGTSSDARHVGDEDLGCSAGRETAARVQREQMPARSLPSVLRLGFYEPSLDYQAGEARASSAERLGIEEQRELPGVISAGDAKALANQMIARAWASRDKLTLRLPPRFLDLQPGSRIDVDLSPRSWTVRQCTIDGFVTVAELAPTWRPEGTVAADAGRIISDKDVAVANLQLALIEVPRLFGEVSTLPTVLLAASSASGRWRSCAVSIVAGTQSFATQTASRRATLGRSLAALPAGDPASIDTINAVDVALIDEDQWLLSCDDAALAEDANLAVLGGEVFQFGAVEPLGQGVFRLSRLVRGRWGTEAAVGTHAADESFVLLERDALRAIDLPHWTIGANVKASARNISGSISESPAITVTGRARETIASPDGGTIVDGEARASIDQILQAMREHGLIAS